MDQLAAMRAFVRVVETGSFSRAAETLSMPKPSMTKLVQGLEAHLRTRLLLRTTRRISVTADGAAYYRRAAQLISELDELDGSMSVSHASPKGRLRVDVGSSIAQLAIIPNLAAFHDRYPEITIDLGVSDRPADLVGENIDCVIRAGELADQSLIARRIAEMRFVTLASPGYIQCHGMPEHPALLETEHRIVGFFGAQNRQMPMEFHRAGERLLVKGRHVLSVNDGNAYVAAGVAGLGIIQAPECMVRPQILADELRPVLTEWTAQAKPLYVVYPPNRHLSARLRVFVDWVAQIFSQDSCLPRLEQA
jgi:LysR family transcriptional regulator for bpeEF and oprC